MKQKVLSKGFNTIRTHPIMQKYGDSRLRGVHAEVDACLRAKAVEGADLYVCRIMKNGEFALAKPCAVCQQILDTMGVARVYYTVDANHFGVMTL